MSHCSTPDELTQTKQDTRDTHTNTQRHTWKSPLLAFLKPDKIFPQPVLAYYFGSFFLNMSRSRALCFAALAPDNAPSLASSFMTSPKLPCNRLMPIVRTAPTASGTHIGGRSLLTTSPTCRAFDCVSETDVFHRCSTTRRYRRGWVGGAGGFQFRFAKEVISIHTHGVLSFYFSVGMIYESTRLETHTRVY